MMIRVKLEWCYLFISTILSPDAGMDVVKAVEKVGSQSGRPSKPVKIVASGEMP